MRHLLFSTLLLSALVVSSCKSGSPEDLPKYKKKFRAQIDSFENQKLQTDQKVEDGVSELTGLQKALENAKNVDVEFKRVYGKWESVDNQVQQLNKEYEALKQDAQNLFDAMQRQTESLSDAKTRNELMKALTATRADYEKNLSKTSVAIEKLRAVHTEAVEVIKALEVAIAMGQVAQINAGLVSIESRVSGIMTELNASIEESKKLYEARIGAI
ncbi:MAG: DUF2959 family protein [Bacteroidia bacterium]|nr:DUF2959 family protein [Bacteroidia bacterium]